MNQVKIKFPFYFKASLFLLGLLVFFYIIYVVQNIVLPFFISVLVAILLNPFVNYLTNHRVNRIIAIFVTLLIGLLIMTGLVFLLITQFNAFTGDLPGLIGKFNESALELIAWVSDSFNISAEKIKAWLTREKKLGIDKSGVLIGNAAITLSRFFVLVLIIPVYIFLLLYYKSLIFNFIAKLFPVRFHSTVVLINSEVKVLVQKYLVGLLIQMAIVATLTALGLWIIGIQSPVLFGIVTALLNLIPYLGVLTANTLIVLVALVTRDASYAVMVLLLYLFVQFIDNNFVVPKIVGGKVKINALAMIIAVLVGGQLYGVAGMFLAIPSIAIFKVVCDHIPSLSALGYILGDTMPKSEISFLRSKKTETKPD
jgi:predicted PurR-regulated permease PerM